MSIPKDLNDLYVAQKTALEAFTSNPFSPYKKDYIQAQKGLWGYTAWMSSAAYSVIETSRQALSYLSSGMSHVSSAAASTTLGQKIVSIVDLVFPVNVVNGKRHFCFVPKSVEKALGEHIFYPLSTRGMHDTFESMPSGSGPIAHKVGSVFQRLISSNEEVLHPSHYETRFNYRIKTVSSSQINAFATPGGGLVVFSQLVKEIDSAILNKSIKESTVTFADGSKATVDLSSVKTEDVLAALIGHEMTHAASRHSMIGLVGQLVRSVVFSIGRYAVMSYLKNTDEQYQKLAKIAEHNRTKAEADLLCSKESSFALINNVLCWLEDKIKSLTNLFHSRQNEYEADVTGVYMAKQAGFNPLGALYLQEVLSTSSNPIHKYLEFLFTHPYGENRKRALLSAIHSFDTAYTEGHIKALNISKVYDETTLSPALMAARQLNFA